MKITDDVLNKVETLFVRNELGKRPELLKTQTTKNNLAQLIEQAIQEFCTTLDHINHDNEEYIKKYNLKDLKIKQKLMQDLNLLEKESIKTNDTLKNQFIDNLYKIKKESLSIEENFYKFQILVTLQNTKEYKQIF